MSKLGDLLESLITGEWEPKPKEQPFDWWEYDTASTQVLPLVVGPPIPDIPMTPQERCEMGALEAYARAVERGEITP